MDKEIRMKLENMDNGDAVDINGQAVLLCDDKYLVVTGNHKGEWLYCCDENELLECLGFFPQTEFDEVEFEM